MTSESSLLRDIPWRWLVCWLLLPNIAVIALWPIVGMPMQAVIVVSGALALIVSQLPWQSVRRICAVLLFVVVTTIYVCKVFSIWPLHIDMLVQSLADLRPMRSPEYFVGIAMGLAVIATLFWTVPRVPRLKGTWQTVLATCAILVFLDMDMALAAKSRTVGQDLPPAGTPVESAVLQVDLERDKESRRNVLLVVVEALGVPARPEEQAIFAADWDRPAWRTRYEVTTGTSRYFGSTRNGEMRELCGQWAEYTITDFPDVDCLPARFRAAGYETTAIHAFTGRFFNRKEWYPRMGFNQSVFKEDLYKAGARECDGVFIGACDVDIAPMIASRLKRAKEPQFIYWLTLNTHVPVGADPVLGTEKCTLGSAQWRDDFPPLCRLYQLHHHLADSISTMIMAKDFPDTDILIVGDHRPPIFDRHELARFRDGMVPWVYLRARGGSEPADARVDRVALATSRQDR